MLIPYTIREGLAGFKRARFAVAASTGAMAVALVLVGVFVLTMVEAREVTGWLRQRVGEIELFLEGDDPRISRAILARARVTPGVETADYISRQQAQAIFQKEFGEGAEIFFDEPFLPASIRVRVEGDYANPDSLNRLAKEFRSWNRVSEVVYNQGLLVKVQRNLRTLTLIGIALGTLVALAAVFLVANTIRLTIYARRLMIRTMKLVGATDTFIRRPFVVEGVVQGLVAGLFAGLLLWIVRGLLALSSPVVSAGAGSAILLTLGLMSIGIALGWAGSTIAVRRFLKTVSLH